PGHPARLLDLAARRGGAAERDVVRERHGEEEGFLRYDRDRAPQPRLLDPGEVDSPELDRSVGDRIEPREEPDEGGLPRADGADDAEDPAGSHREGHVVK